LQGMRQTLFSGEFFRNRGRAAPIGSGLPHAEPTH
jgi:hypothetical protein